MNYLHSDSFAHFRRYFYNVSTVVSPDLHPVCFDESNLQGISTWALYFIYGDTLSSLHAPPGIYSFSSYLVSLGYFSPCFHWILVLYYSAQELNSKLLCRQIHGTNFNQLVPLDCILNRDQIHKQGNDNVRDVNIHSTWLRNIQSEAIRLTVQKELFVSLQARKHISESRLVDISLI